MTKPDDPEKVDAERWFVVDGRRWRRVDPSLPDDVVRALASHLACARSAVRAAKRAGDEDALIAARARVGIAKRGLGERGLVWWSRPVPERVQKARIALIHLDEVAPPKVPRRPHPDI